MYPIFYKASLQWPLPEASVEESKRAVCVLGAERSICKGGRHELTARVLLGAEGSELEAWKPIPLGKAKTKVIKTGLPSSGSFLSILAISLLAGTTHVHRVGLLSG